MDLKKAKAISDSILSLSELEKEKRAELTESIEKTAEQIEADLKELYWAIPQDISIKIGASNEKKNVQVTVCAMKHSATNDGMLTVEVSYYMESCGTKPFCKFGFDTKNGYGIDFCNSFHKMTEMPAVINTIRHWDFICDELEKSLEVRLLEIQEGLKNTITGLNTSINILEKHQADNNNEIVKEDNLDEIDDYIVDLDER